MMKIKISPAYTIVFLLLTICMLEFHEICHIVAGRLICGGWGVRDFNVWALCEDCKEHNAFYWLATLAGPVFSFTMMWAGMFLLSSPTQSRKAVGFSLIFANIPFGRITEAMKGSGDEMVVAKYLLKDHFSLAQIIFTCAAILLLLGLPPIVAAFRVLKNKYSWLYLIGFLTLPIAFILVYVLIVMNSVLKSGFLSTIGIMGTPLLITIHTVIAIALLALMYKKLFLLNQSKS